VNQMIESMVLGIIQGLTEFLPISSTAHLVILPRLFHWNSLLLNSLTFDVALHVGTLLAVVSYFFRETLELIRGIFKGILKLNFNTDSQSRESFLIFVGIIPAGILGALLERWVENQFRTPLVLIIAMVVVGALMWYAEKLAKKTKRVDNMPIVDAVIIGLAQALALIPGTSRSGVTISSGLLLGYGREDAARFSFLLSIPVIAGAAMLKLRSFTHGIPQGEIAPLLVGTLFSSGFGFLSIKYFMKFVQNHPLNLFVWYRFLFAIIIIIFMYII
jgi:undecaprenyl-diphosphatase